MERDLPLVETLLGPFPAYSLAVILFAMGLPRPDIHNSSYPVDSFASAIAKYVGG